MSLASEEVHLGTESTSTASRPPHGLRFGTRRWWAGFAVVGVLFGGLWGLGMRLFAWNEWAVHSVIGAAVAGAGFALLFLRECRAVRLAVDAGEPTTMQARFLATVRGLKWSAASTPHGAQCDIKAGVMARYSLDLEIRPDGVAVLTGPKVFVKHVVRKMGGRVLGPA